MGRVAKKYIPDSEMVTKKEFCKILHRCARFFDEKKKEGVIIPCARDGVRFLYLRKDAERLREQLVEYLR